MFRSQEHDHEGGKHEARHTGQEEKEEAPKSDVHGELVPRHTTTIATSSHTNTIFFIYRVWRM